LQRVFNVLTGRRLKYAADRDKKPASPKETMVILQMINHLSTLDKSMQADLFEWINDSTKQFSIKEVALAKMMAVTLLNLQHGCVKPHVSQQIAMDAFVNIGKQTHGEDIAVKPRVFDIMCAETSPSILLCMIAEEEKMVEDAEWCIHHWKDVVVVAKIKSDKDADDGDVKMIELAICEQMTSVCNSLIPILSTKIPAGNTYEPIVKLLRRYFTVMGNFVKIVRLLPQKLTFG
jgi:hypothetical protein